MKDVWSPAGQQALRAFARDDTLIVLDYDGTLAPIVDNPDQATLRPATRDLLARVALRYATVVLTGRARADAMRLLADVSNIEVIGNHGAETAWTPSHPGAHTKAWKPLLQAGLEHLRGVVIEDKGQSLSVHFRAAEDPVSAAADIERVASGLSDVRLVRGKFVLNLVGRDVPNKATALVAEMARQGRSRSLFVGDDVTDEDVFALKMPEHLLTVRVGESPASLAQYFLPDQRGVEALLRFLVET